VPFYHLQLSSRWDSIQSLYIILDFDTYIHLKDYTYFYSNFYSTGSVSMSAPLVLNLRVIELKETGEGAYDAHIALSHFGTDSGILYQCSFKPDQAPAVWGAAVEQLNGDAFSYFGQFIGEESTRGQTFIASNENLDKLTSFNRDRLMLFSNALSFMLNELFQADKGRDAFITPGELKSVIDDQTAVLRPDYTQPDKMELYIVPLFLKQRDFAIGLAKISDSFNINVPRYHMEGNGAKGHIDNLLESVDQKEKTH
jgi:hypothetical protein